MSLQWDAVRLTFWAGQRQRSNRSTTSCLFCASATIRPPSPPGSLGFLQPGAAAADAHVHNITRSHSFTVGPRAAGHPLGRCLRAIWYIGASREHQTSFDVHDALHLVMQTLQFCVTCSKANKHILFCKHHHEIQVSVTCSVELHAGLLQVSIWQRCGKNYAWGFSLLISLVEQKHRGNKEFVCLFVLLLLTLSVCADRWLKKTNQNSWNLLGSQGWQDGSTTLNLDTIHQDSATNHSWRLKTRLRFEALDHDPWPLSEPRASKLLLRPSLLINRAT